MPPLRALMKPFVPRVSESQPARAASAELPRPFVAGASPDGLVESARAPFVGSIVDDRDDPSVATEDLPWLSEAAGALAGFGTRGEELLAPAPEAAPAQAAGDEPQIEPWDDELGTFALSEELPTIDSAGEFGSVTEQSPAVEGEVEIAGLGKPVANASVSAGTVERVAQRLEEIARILRQRGATGPLEEGGSDPLGALITGYVLGMSGSGKSEE